MPPLTRRFIKTALIYLVATFFGGLLLAAQSLWSLGIPSSRLDPVYLHLFMVGWVTQLIFGVAYWMFPVYSREAPRRSPALGQVTYFLLNGGLLLYAAGELLGSAWLPLLGTILLLVAAMAFVFNSWGRVTGR